MHLCQCIYLLKRTLKQCQIYRKNFKKNLKNFFLLNYLRASYLHYVQSPLDTLFSIFSTTDSVFRTNHNKIIKIRKLTLILYYHLILKHHASFMNYLELSLPFAAKGFRSKSHITFSCHVCLFSLLQPFLTFSLTFMILKIIEQFFCSMSSVYVFIYYWFLCLWQEYHRSGARFFSYPIMISICPIIDVVHFNYLVKVISASLSL